MKLRTWMILLFLLGNSLMLFPQRYHVGDVITNPDGSKGVVFHINQDGLSGWMVALRDTTSSYWGAAGNDCDVPGIPNDTISVNLLGDTAGYHYTQLLREFQGNNPNYAAGLVDFEHGWYLPTIGQLRILMSKLPLINDALVSNGGAGISRSQDTTGYWSSSEYNATNAFGIRCNFYYHETAYTGGLIYVFHKSRYVRAVRAVRNFTMSGTSLSYQWEPGGETTQDIVVAPAETTTYSVAVMINNGNVMVSDSITLSVIPENHEVSSVSACDSYEWHDSTYTENGTYVHEYVNEAGCPDADTLHLTITGLHETWLEDQICVGTNYTSNGFNIIAPPEGTLNDTLFLLDAMGCDSTVYLTLTVTEGLTTYLEDQSCVGADYLANGFTILHPEEGIVYDTLFLHSMQGCDSTVYLTLTVTEGLTTYLEDQNCVGADYTANGFNIIQPELGVVYDTLFLQSVQGCDSTVYLTLTVTEGLTTYLEDQSCRGADYIANGFTILHPEEGIVYDTLYLHSVQGCDSTVYLTLTVSEGLTTYFEDRICVGNNYTLHGFNIINPLEGVVYDTLFLHSYQGCDSTVFLRLDVEQVLQGDTTVLSEYPFTWYGELYVVSGDYPHTFLGGSYLGCDSTVMLHLSVLPAVHGDTTVVSCDAFKWYGHTYEVSGNYPHTISGGSHFGIDTTIVLHLSVLPVLPGDTTAASCEPLLWYGQYCDTTGNYQHTFVDASHLGCDSIVTLHLRINPAATFEWHQQSCESFQWNDSVYEVSGIYTQYYNTTQGCDSIVTLHLDIGHEVHTDTVTQSCDFFLWHGQSCVESGFYHDTLQSVIGCDSIVTLELTLVNPQIEIIGYQEVFYASDVWHGIYHYYLEESTGLDLGPIEWQCDQPEWTVFTDPSDPNHCMLLVKTVGTATLTAHISSIAGCDDLFSIQINATEYIEEEEPDIQVYPNPATTKVTIVAQNMVVAKVINAFGQVVKYVLPQNNNTTTFSVEDFKAGVYFVEIQTHKETVVDKLVIKGGNDK